MTRLDLVSRCSQTLIKSPLQCLIYLVFCLPCTYTMNNVHGIHNFLFELTDWKEKIVAWPSKVPILQEAISHCQVVWLPLHCDKHFCVPKKIKIVCVSHVCHLSDMIGRYYGNGGCQHAVSSASEAVLSIPHLCAVAVSMITTISSMKKRHFLLLGLINWFCLWACNVSH